ncbi:hypothetical protein C9374_003492 [Naegleria lovaniensis]|uniref:Uncharacterized protein n=1 Tax=Naegleria lovaniensis TaxID=51637 RepID=A0AA88KPR4_NAELO|nr:uncharacterized protein C9374_003492 [Naegleria lovaniensis]KAG2385677.1 hypothetical protein C9374_003492 [Naegleria lovaniensis]
MLQQPPNNLQVGESNPNNGRDEDDPYENETSESSTKWDTISIPKTSSIQPIFNPFKLLLESEDILITVIEFMDRSFVLWNISLCSKYFHQLTHKPYAYTRLSWNFSRYHLQRLDLLAKYYSQLRYLEIEDSINLKEKMISELDVKKFIDFLRDHSSTIQHVDMVFHRHQELLFNTIVKESSEWLRSLSLKISLWPDFACKACQMLNQFSQLEKLKIKIGNSIDPELVLSSCRKLFEKGKLVLFHSTTVLRTKAHVLQFIDCLKLAQKSIKDVEFSMNSLEDNELDEVMVKLNDELSCCRRITITLIEVQDLSTVNKFTELSSTCSEFNINLIGVKSCKPETRLTLQNVKEFNVETAKYDPKTNTFPNSMSHLTFQYTSFMEYGSRIDMEFFQAFKLLRTCSFHQVEIPSIEDQSFPLPLLEKLHCSNCRIQNIYSLLKFPKLIILELERCSFMETPKIYSSSEGKSTIKLKELSITNMKKSGTLNLQMLQHMQLEKLQLTYINHDSSFLEHLHFIEDMTSLTYLNLSGKKQVISQILKHMNFKHLTNLNHLIMKNDFTDRRDEILKVNSSIYHLIHNTSIILPLLSSSQNFINVEPEKYHHGGETVDIPILKKDQALQIVTKFIPRSYQAQEGELLNVLYSRDYHYITFCLHGKFGYVLVKNEAPHYPFIKGLITKETIEGRRYSENLFLVPAFSGEKSKLKCEII